MLGIDVDQFRVKAPWKDFSFWIAALSSAIALVGVLVPDIATWVHDNEEALLAAVLPLSIWLASHGYIRSRAVTALGEVATEVAHQEGQALTAQLAPAGITDHVTEPVVEPAGVTKAGI